MKNLMWSLLVCAVILSCEQWSDGGANQPQDPEQQMLEEKYQSTPAILTAPTIEEFIVADFTADQRMDTLVLSVNAERDDQGRIAWDDAHIWQVRLRTKMGPALLYEQSIQLGKLLLYHAPGTDQVFLVEKGPYANKRYQIDFSGFAKLVEVEAIPGLQDMEVINLEE